METRRAVQGLLRAIGGCGAGGPEGGGRQARRRARRGVVRERVRGGAGLGGTGGCRC